MNQAARFTFPRKAPDVSLHFDNRRIAQPWSGKLQLAADFSPPLPAVVWPVRLSGARRFFAKSLNAR
jgi:hypothetical protein